MESGIVVHLYRCGNGRGFGYFVGERETFLGTEVWQPEVTCKVGVHPRYMNKDSGRGFRFANQEVNRENVHLHVGCVLMGMW
jgi:hypothetical protein